MPTGLHSFATNKCRDSVPHHPKPSDAERIELLIFHFNYIRTFVILNSFVTVASIFSEQIIYIHFILKKMLKFVWSCGIMYASGIILGSVRFPVSHSLGCAFRLGQQRAE